MTFSIIIPTCNRNELLSKCLECLCPTIQNIDAGEYEIIVSDDSSENVAKNLVTNYYPWAKWVEGPTKGPAANRNNGAREAKAEWLVFLDDDCLPDKGLLNEYYTAIKNNTDIGVFEGAIYCEERIKSPLFISPINLAGGHLWSCNFCIQKEIFSRFNGFDEEFKFANLEDNDLHYRLKENNIDIKFLKDALVNHPPRKMPSPRKFMQLHESWLYYHKKIGQTKSVFQLLKTILITRIKYITRFPFSKDSLVALGNLVVELWYTTFKYGFHKTN